MAELLWFLGGALVYQMLIKVLRISQLYVLFQEIHAHTLLMLDSASQDLETAVQLKMETLEASAVEQDQVKLINHADKQAVETWRTTTVIKIQQFVPNVFKSAIKYDNWNEMKKYLRDILKS